MAYIPHTYASIYIQKNANRVSCAVCLELVEVQAQTIIFQEGNASLLWMPGGHVAIASAVEDGGIVYCGAIPSPVPVGKLRLYWIIWTSLEPRFRHIYDDAHQDNSLLCRKGSNILPLPCATFNLPSHTSTCGSVASTVEYERHRACLSVKISTDEPSHVPLHARILRGAALSS